MTDNEENNERPKSQEERVQELFVSYKVYKGFGGTMSEGAFDQVRHASWEQIDYRRALSELSGLDYDPRAIHFTQGIIYAKISGVFPDKDPTWKEVEMLLVQGKG